MLFPVFKIAIILLIYLKLDKKYVINLASYFKISKLFSRASNNGNKCCIQ